MREMYAPYDEPYKVQRILRTITERAKRAHYTYFNKCSTFMMDGKWALRADRLYSE